MYSLLIQGEQNMRFVLVALATLSLVVTAHAADFSGTWKMNPAKSHVPTDTSGNVTSSMTIKIEQPRPDTLSFKEDSVWNSGEKHHWETDYVCDGEKHPVKVVGGTPPLNTLQTCHIDSANGRLEHQLLQSGRVRRTNTFTLSPDAKTLTRVRTGAG